MVGVAPDEGNRRRLPVWMLGVAAADQTTKSDDVQENNNHINKGLVPKVCHSDAKTVTIAAEKAILLQEKELLGVNSHVLVKCETKRRKRKSSQQDANSKTVLEKKQYNVLGRKVRESSAQKRHKAKSSGFGSSEEFESHPPGDDDVQLTMEDLMTIAEEYVKAEKNMERQATNRECGSEIRLPSTVTSMNDLGGSLDAPNSNRRSPTHETTSFSSTAILASEEIATGDKRTGDVAQDMLDLFLGPLLKKPLKEENKSITKDMAFAYEFERQSQNNVVGEEMEPLMKKKSSLKDKVAMFLD